MKNIAVFFGGVSVEHEISVITGVLTSNSLDKDKFRALPVYVDEKGEWYTGEYLLDPDNYKNFDAKRVKKVTLTAGSNNLYLVKNRRIKPICEISAAINCMHGERGEDGSLAGILNMCGIPLVSPPMLPSAVSMDKSFTKIFLKGMNVRALPSITVRSAGEMPSKRAGFGFPVIVKPVCGGSSIGLRSCNDKRALAEAVAYALRFGDRAIIEPCLTGFTEINCAAYRGRKGIAVSECERPVGKTEILSFKDKYECGKREFPADIPPEISERIKKITAEVYERAGFSGIVRIDYFVSDGKIYLNEINSVPGSLAYYLFTETLSGFTEILTELITVCIEKFAAENTVQKSFRSGILRSVGGKSSKRL